ncbi:MAG: SDR family oxidoreductase [Planctomycetota bacterium]
MHTYVITGANRGLGLELARQLKDAGHTVIGTARTPEPGDELHGIADRVASCDVTSDASVRALAASLDGTPIDVLINNAGFGPNAGTIDQLDMDNFEQAMAINALGPARVAKALLPQLRAGGGRRIVSISSQLGSIENAAGGGYHAYRASKAALNMLNRCMAHDLASDGFICLAIHPGWVRTRMGGEQAPLSPQESARGMIEVINGMTPSHNGAFVDHLGETLPW